MSDNPWDDETQNGDRRQRIDEVGDATLTEMQKHWRYLVRSLYLETYAPRIDKPEALAGVKALAPNAQVFCSASLLRMSCA